MSDLRMGVGISVLGDTAAAVHEAIRAARSTLGAAPAGLALVAATEEHDPSRLYAELRQTLGDTPIHGSTTSLGVLSAGGIAMEREGALGVLLFQSPKDARFAVGGARAGGAPREMGRAAARQVVASGGAAEPQILLIAATPGNEEEVIAGIGEILPGVPVFGGSAADHAIKGAWSVFSSDGAIADGVSLAAVFGDVRLGAAIVAPYRPTPESAIITQSTAASGRAIALLGGQPATRVLASWVGAEIDEQVRDGGNVLVQTALSPLGIAHETGGHPYYVLLHPAQAHADGTLDVFARAPHGATVRLMSGSVDALVGVVDVLVDRALAAAQLRPSEVRGAFMIYCAGCAGAVGPRVSEAPRRVRELLGDVAVLGLCTFGEQGWVEGIGNIHTNLSVSLTVFG